MKPLERFRRIDLAVIAILSAIALAARLYGIRWGLPLIDEEAYPLKAAWGMWGWGPDRHFDLNPHFFKYPSLTIYLQLLGQAVLYGVLTLAGAVHSALDFRVLYEMHPTPFYVAGRTVTALFGVATVVPTYLLGLRAAGRGAATAAALLVAVNLPLIAKSQLIEVDVPLACLVTWSLWMALRLADRPSVRAAAGAGVMVGLAVSAKYPGLLAILPGLLAVVLPSRKEAGGAAHGSAGPPPRAKRDRPPAREGRTRERSRRPASLTLVFPLLAGLLAALLVTSPYLLLDAGSFLRDLGDERQHMRLGHFGEAQGMSWGFYALAGARLAGWPLAIAAAAGIAFFLWRRERWALVLAGFPLASFALFGSWTMKADRYLLPLIPVAAVFAGALAHRGLAALRPAAGRAARVAVWLVVFAALAWPQALAVPAHLQRQRPDARALARAWIESNVPAGSFILAEAYTPDLVSATTLARFDAELRQAICRRQAERPIYAVQPLPMYQVAPERSEDFYDPRFFELADVVVVTAGVRDRYRAEPARFRRQLAAYDSLERRFVKAFEAKGAGGSDIVVYRNPRATAPFARRGDPGTVPTLDQRTAAYGGEAAFYYMCGVNCEAFGFREPALTAYRQSVLFGLADRPALMSASRGIVRCLVAEGRREEAMAFLAEQARQDRPPAEVAELVELQRELGAGTFRAETLLCP